MGLENINIFRKQKEFSLEELSQKSGVPLGTLSKISAGITKDPKLETIKSIARALECTLDDFDDRSGTDRHDKSILTTNQINLLREFEKLNNTGQTKAIERIEELSHIKRYQNDLPISTTLDEYIK